MITPKKLFVLGILVLFLAGCSTSYDLVIKEGTIYDGMGGAPYAADVGIENGTIKTIGDIKTSAGSSIDAKGMIVAPGFIDIHTHCESGLHTGKGKNAKNYLMQGVTTVVTGNCGGGTYRVKEFYNKLESQGIGLNVIHLVGHGTIRGSVMGQEAREPSDDELDRMKQQLAQGMAEGPLVFPLVFFTRPGVSPKRMILSNL